jgi:hypothetical protein
MQGDGAMAKVAQKVLGFNLEPKSAIEFRQGLRPPLSASKTRIISD